MLALSWQRLCFGRGRPLLLTLAGLAVLSRSPTMAARARSVPRARSGQEDDEAGGGCAAALTVLIRVPREVKTMLETVLQHHLGPGGKGTRTAAAERVLRGLDIKKGKGKWNLGHVVAALAGTVFSWDTGKQVWRLGDTDQAPIEWNETSGKGGSNRPVPERATAMGSAASVNMQHDAAAPTTGTTAAKRAAASRRPEPPRALELVPAEAADRLVLGSGWGNMPRAIASCCVAEQVWIDLFRTRTAHTYGAHGRHYT